MTIALALYEPDIPQNTGSMMRLCACMGVSLHIIEPCGFVLDDKALKRVAMDYSAQTQLIRHNSWERFLDARQGRLVLLTTKTDQSYTDFAFRADDILVLGRESAGVPQQVADAMDAHVTIRMQPNARSLNVALAASMVLGEALRQTRNI
jgi:tRNA (cytidine/uridine-2'-O-)-methyltransferase